MCKTAVILIQTIKQLYETCKKQTRITAGLFSFCRRFGKTTTYNDAIGLPNISTNRVELSLIYRIKIF